MTDIRPVSLLFGGDFAPIRGYDALISSSGGLIFGDAREIIAASHFTMFNLEAPACRSGEAIDKVGPNLRAEPETLKALSVNGVDAVCLANNHIFDYGQDGLVETLRQLDAHGIRHVGAGIDRPSAEAPLRLVLDGRKVSIFSFAEREFNLSDDGQSGAAQLDPLRIAPLLMSERVEADAIVVCVHGGNEYFAWPRPGLRQICRFLVDMGADAVVGHHPHVPGPYEIYSGRPIFYSLGNLIFDNVKPPAEWDLGYLVRVELNFRADGRLDVLPHVLPYRQSVGQGGVRLLRGEERRQVLAKIEAMRDRLENRPDAWLSEWREFVATKSRQARIDLLSPIRFPGLRRLLGLPVIRDLISAPSRRLHRINLLRCQSHHELTLSALERLDP